MGGREGRMALPRDDKPYQRLLTKHLGTSLASRLSLRQILPRAFRYGLRHGWMHMQEPWRQPLSLIGR
jgi:hypothetical protein